MNSSTKGTAVRTRGRSGGVIVPRAVTEWDELDPYDFRLAVWLSTHDPEFGERISQHRMAQVLKMSQDRVAKSLARLEALGVIEVERATAPFALSITFDQEAWETCAIPATRESTSRHTGMTFPPHGNKENTSEKPQESLARSRIDAGFAEFWLAYPRKLEKKSALKAYERAVLRAEKGGRGVRIRVILAGAQRYAAVRKGQDEQYTKHAASWLNGDCWEDLTPDAATRRETSEELRERQIREYNSVQYT